ncbi:hypothetical protein [Moorella sulfitireducens (nom. illeg.)]|nr:hypothetical protein [Moorella sulfitireducens]
MAFKIEAKRAEKPRFNGMMLYDELVKDGGVLMIRFLYQPFTVI